MCAKRCCRKETTSTKRTPVLALAVEAQWIAPAGGSGFPLRAGLLHHDVGASGNGRECDARAGAAQGCAGASTLSEAQSGGGATGGQRRLQRGGIVNITLDEFKAAAAYATERLRSLRDKLDLHNGTEAVGDKTNRASLIPAQALAPADPA